MTVDLVAGGCPDCVCDPILCACDDTGEHCIESGCGACQDGCPTDEHDMTIRAERAQPR